MKMVFQNTPGTEAPAEMNTYFPQFKAFWAAENITGTVHNIYTLRGALVRDALEWSKQINIALYRFGQEAETMFSAHTWPRWGNARIQEVMRTQRDIYANLNNEVLHLANQGVTINEIHNVYKPPKSLQNQWAAHSYHGSEEHNSRAVVNRYLGYWDANPATLIPLSPRDSAPLYVEMMGGAEKILAKGKELYDQGKYRHAIEILNKLVYAEPTTRLPRTCWPMSSSRSATKRKARACATASSVPRSNSAQASRAERRPRAAGQTWFVRCQQTCGSTSSRIRLDSKKAEGMKFVINLVTPDNGEKFV